MTRRLLLAKWPLLTETRLPITDVAFAAGFASICRFNDAWQQAYGSCTERPAQAGKLAKVAPQSSLQLHLLYRPPFDVQAMLAFPPAARHSGAGAGG